MGYFTGKTAFITGGSSGIGLETARLLVAEGCRLVLFARGHSRLEQVCRDIEHREGLDKNHVNQLAMDVSNNDDVQDKINKAVTLYGSPDILINSAGIGTADYFENISYENFDQVMKACSIMVHTTLWVILQVTRIVEGLHPMPEAVYALKKMPNWLAGHAG